MKGQIPVLFMYSSDDNDGDLTDTPGQDWSKKNVSNADDAEESAPTKSSKPSMTQHFMSELQSRINHKKKRILNK